VHCEDARGNRSRHLRWDGTLRTGVPRLGAQGHHAHLLGDLLVVRLQGVLTAAEQHLVKSLSAEKGRDLLKEVRPQLIETGRPVLDALVQEATGAKVLTLHHDVSTVTAKRSCFSLWPSPLNFGKRSRDSAF
jgi:uncharacterized protein YbcI